MSAEHDNQRPHRLRVAVSNDDWSRGPADAPVTLVEYADYECPHCQAAHPVLEELLRAHADRLRFVVRHFPVTSAHPRAAAAALAAEAAGRQGKFWEMHARLFGNPGQLDPADLRRHARDLGLDLERFQDDLDDPRLAGKIQEHRRQGLRSGVNGTPTLFFNGARHDGARDLESLSQAVEKTAEG
jgi:protein-disulfide isomerase